MKTVLAALGAILTLASAGAASAAVVYDFSSGIQAGGAPGPEAPPPGPSFGDPHVSTPRFDLPASGQSIDILIEFSGLTISPSFQPVYKEHYAYSQPDPVTGFYPGNEGDTVYLCIPANGCFIQTSPTTMEARFTAPVGFGSWDACPPYNPLIGPGKCYDWWTPDSSSSLGLPGVDISYRGLTTTPGYTYDLCKDCTLKVTITPVPEPRIWAMLVAGVLGVGAMLRRRRGSGGLAAA